MCEALPFKPYRQKDIEWRALDDDDFIAEKKINRDYLYIKSRADGY